LFPLPSETRHRILKGGALAVEGWETRVWAGKDPADPEKIKSKPIPPDVVEKLTR
jgi:4-hydroxybenzoyl-CoA thioesterase